VLDLRNTLATHIVAALATCGSAHRRVLIGYALGFADCAARLVVSTLTDLPSGPTVLWVMTALALAYGVLSKAMFEGNAPITR
jgi:hypothetical protein